MDPRRTPATLVRMPMREHAATPRSISRSSSHTSQDSLRSAQAMVIPGLRFEDAPPPLPPPRFNEELAQGIDVAWSWGNSFPFRPEGRLAPIKPGSSLYGSYREARQIATRYHDDDEMDMDLDDDDQRRSSTVSTVRSPSLANIETGIHTASLGRGPTSPKVTNQRLHGELPLAQETITRSSQAYDQRLLSKIGKPVSPPQRRRSGSVESTTWAKNSLQLKESRSPQAPSNEQQLGSFDPVSRWISNPLSAGASPGSRPGWRDYNPLDPRSPSSESTSASLILDPELFVQQRPGLHVYTGVSALGTDDSSSYTSRSHRGSCDHGIFSEADTDLTGDDGSTFRNLKLSDSQRQLGPQASKPGVKRRAQSPPNDAARDRSPSRGTVSADMFSKVHNSSLTRSPMFSYQPKHGSISSTASSARQNSYASSIAPSIAGSSMTSISSFDRQSPLDAPGHHGYITSAPSVTSPAPSVPPSRNLVMQSPSDSNKSLRKMSIQTAINEPRLPPATRIGNYFICDCCPKKPKKFDSEDELRSHQMEKQFSCQYCNNRFKNKNEAERHQNSLHLRRHSWSCAAIPAYQDAFHPSSPSVHGPAGSLNDICGFCGEEFPNHPQPDWERRIEHLVNIHKFGECNQGKKFYRADHFRQHLKHSHAGRSGKWTNMLENVCLREEMPGDTTGMSPIGSEPSPGRGPSSLPLSGGQPMGGATINEVNDET